MNLIDHNHFNFKLNAHQIHTVGHYHLSRIHLSTPMVVNHHFYNSHLINEMVNGYLRMGSINRKIVQEFMSCEDEAHRIFEQKHKKE